MSSSVGPALGQGVGYGIVLGVGIAFALFMVRIQCYYLKPQAVC